jgi:hypothetical protein
MKPFRKVVRVIFSQNKYNRPYEGRHEHVLECGHSIVTKASYGTPRRMRCRECPSKETVR